MDPPPSVNPLTWDSPQDRPTTESVLDSNKGLSYAKKDSGIKETHEATRSNQRVNMAV